MTTGTIETPADGATVPGPVTTITGTGERDATVVVTVDGRTYSGTVDRAGNWFVSIPSGISNNGSYDVEAEFTDEAGNEATDTSTFTISACSAGNLCGANATCEDGAPSGYECVCIAGFVMVGGTCVGGNIEITSPTPGYVTNDTTPTVTGTATPNTTVTIVIGGETGTATSDSDGDWSFTPTTPLSHGPHDIEASITLGGTDFTDDSDVTIDLETEVAISTPVDGSTSASPITVVRGTGEPGATITLTIDGGAPLTGTVNGSGTWEITLSSPLLHNSVPYTIVAVAEDIFGNTDSDTSVVTVTIPIAVAVDTPEDGALLNNPTPTVEGTATPGATVIVVFEGDDATFPGCVATADSNGDRHRRAGR